MPYKFTADWPTKSTEPSDILRFASEKNLGLDLEWDLKTGEITQLGIGNAEWGVSCSYRSGKPYLLQLLREHPEIIWNGHNIVGADFFKLASDGIEIPIDHAEDSIIRHWLSNMHLCKTTRKEADPDDKEEKKGRGFMNLWTAASIYTSLRCWKYCRDGIPLGKWRAPVECEGPCPVHQPDHYNVVDVVAPVRMIPQMKKSMMLRGTEKLYPMHRDLSFVLAKMQHKGVFTDQSYIAKMREEFTVEKAALVEKLPFNPDSWQQALKYFHSGGIDLDNAQEETIRNAVNHYNAEKGTTPELVALADWLEYKELGNGVDRWFAPMVWNEKNRSWDGFVDAAGWLHPSLGFFTSSARLMCVGPNLQNVTKRRVSRRTCICGHRKEQHYAVAEPSLHHACFVHSCSCQKFTGEAEGKKVRRAIIAPPGFIIVRGDYSNAENRNFLYLAGYPPPEGDLHAWMVANIGLTEQDEFSIKLGSARDASKSVTHAADYGEGLQLKSPWELKKGKCREEIAAGARLVFLDWTFRGRVVTFTGINLANRAYGKASYENRRKCLEIVERYIGNGKALPSDFGPWPTGPFPKIRDLQARIWKQCETEKIVRPPHAYCLLSFGYDEDRMKQAAAVWGSQPVAHFTKLAILKLDAAEKNGSPYSTRLQVHDELFGFWPEDRDPLEGCRHLAKNMLFETAEMPGFSIPVETSYGSNWRDQTKVKEL